MKTTESKKDGKIEFFLSVTNYCLKGVKACTKVAGLLMVVGIGTAATADILISRNRKKIRKGGES